MSKKAQPGFYILSESWYASSSMASEKRQDSNFVDEIMVGLYYSGDGGCDGEFAIRFSKINYEVYPRLEAYSDSWNILHRMPDFMKMLAKLDKDRRYRGNLPPSKEKIIEELKKLGFKDLTKRTG